MSEPVRIRVRCGERVRKEWRKACGYFDLTYAEMALHAARFIMENEEDFRRFVYEDEKSR
jgi:hypothetical protein